MAAIPIPNLPDRLFGGSVRFVRDGHYQDLIYDMGGYLNPPHEWWLGLVGARQPGEGIGLGLTLTKRTNVTDTVRYRVRMYKTTIDLGDGTKTYSFPFVLPNISGGTPPVLTPERRQVWLQDHRHLEPPKVVLMNEVMITSIATGVPSVNVWHRAFGKADPGAQTMFQINRIARFENVILERPGSTTIEFRAFGALRNVSDGSSIRGMFIQSEVLRAFDSDEGDADQGEEQADEG